MSSVVKEIKPTDLVKEAIRKVLPGAELRLAFVQSGVLVEAISQEVTSANDAHVKESIFQELFNLRIKHKILCSPHRIFTYGNQKESFKARGILREKAHSYENGIHTTYASVGDAHILVPEFDVEALEFGVERPFTIIAMQMGDNKYPFKVFAHAKYAELDLEGSHYRLSGDPKPFNHEKWQIQIS